MNLPHMVRTEPRGSIVSPQPSSRLRVPRALTVPLVWLAEFVVLFIVAEAVAGFFLPPGLTFDYPQMLMQGSARRIYEPVPNQRAFTMDKPYVTNSLGFRDDREVPLNKNRELRILSLGDSISVGLGVTEKDTYTHVLEASLLRRYGAVRVINAGVAGYSAWQTLDLLKDTGLRVQPDIVLFEFFPGDNMWAWPRTITPLPPGVIKQQNDARITVLRQLKRSRILYFLRERLEIARLRFFPTDRWTRQQMLLDGRTNPTLDQVESDWRGTFEELAMLGRIHHFVPVLILYPFPEQVFDPEARAHIQQRIEAIVRPLGLRVIDLLSPLRAEYVTAHNLIIPWDNVHMAPRGHQVVARTLERYLVGTHLVSRRR